MLRSDRFGSPPRRDNHPPPPAHHEYESSDDDSYGRINSLSRSESGTSRTHYEDLANPSPKALMNQYNARGSLDWEHAVPMSPMQNTRRATAGVLQDPMALRLLVEMAVADSASFDVMSVDELEELKREEAAIARKLPNLRRDLQLEMKLRDAAQSFSRMSDPDASQRGPQAMSSDEYAASARKCEDLSTELYNLERRATSLADRRLKHTAAVLQIDYEQRTGQDEFQRVNADQDDWVSGFNLRSFAPGGLADTFDGIMDIPGGDPETDATINHLWNHVASHDAERGLHNGEDFSLEGFSAKVQGLCERAADLESQLRQASSDQAQQSHDQHLSTQKKLEDSQSHLMETRGNLDQTKQELDFVKQQHEETKKKHENEHSDLSAEVARLQTEVTIARAELDGAYGSRAERAADIAENPVFKVKMETLEGRNGELEKELRELVAEHEALTRQGVDTEREREGLETTIDQLREKVESLELKLGEERLRKATRPEGDAAAAADTRSLGLLRAEFKKMMRDSRAEQFKVLKVCSSSAVVTQGSSRLTTDARLNKKRSASWKRHCEHCAKKPARTRLDCHRRRCHLRHCRRRA